MSNSHLIQPTPAAKAAAEMIDKSVAATKKTPGAADPPGAGCAMAAEYTWPQWQHFISFAPNVRDHRVAGTD